MIRGTDYREILVDKSNRDSIEISGNAANIFTKRIFERYSILDTVI